MGKTWQLQEAKNHFSEVVENALHTGPQTVTRHGKEAVVILSADEYRRLSRPRLPLADFFRASPLSGVELDLARQKDLPRESPL